MSNKQIVGSSFVSDLAILLKNYLEPLDIFFCFCGERMFLNEVFMKCGALSLFLFDKEEFLQKEINTLNKNNPKEIPFLINLCGIEKEQDTYFGFEIEIEHNLFYETVGEINDQQYWFILFKLAEKILTDKVFKVVDNNKIILDDIYDEMCKAVNEKTLTIKSNKTL